MIFRNFLIYTLIGLNIWLPALIALEEEPIYDRSKWGGPEWEKFAEENFTPPAPFSLIGGDVPPMSDWPVSIWIGNCSATVTGAQAVASAAHCMSNGANISFTLGPNRYSARCTHHPDYRGNATADWALCKTTEVVIGGDYERLNTDPGLLSLGQEITLSGYGCTKWGSGIDGRFRIGEAPIVSLPSGSNHDIVTRGNVALCSGDSGGKCANKRDKKTRVVLGVNSRSNTTTTSYMPSWAQPTAQAWAKQWADTNGVKICGIHPDAEGCRKSCEEEPDAFTGPDRLVFEGTAVRIGKANPKQTCSWMPANTLSDPNSCNPFAFPSKKTTYTLIASTECGSKTGQVTVTPIGVKK